MLTRLLEDSIMPAESSMRRGRACSSVMVIQLIFYLGFLFVFVQRHLVGDLFPVYQHNCFPYNLLPQMLQLTRCPSGENQQKNNECPPLWTDFHKVNLQNISTIYMRQKHWIGHNFSPTFMYISHNFCTKFTHITHNQTTHSFHHFHISLTQLSHNFHTAFTNLWHDFSQWDKCWASSIEEEDSSTCWEEGGCWSKVKWI